MARVRALAVYIPLGDPVPAGPTSKTAQHPGLCFELGRKERTGLSLHSIEVASMCAICVTNLGLQRLCSHVWKQDDAAHTHAFV